MLVSCRFIEPRINGTAEAHVISDRGIRDIFLHSIRIELGDTSVAVPAEIISYSRELLFLRLLELDFHHPAICVLIRKLHLRNSDRTRVRK